MSAIAAGVGAVGSYFASASQRKQFNKMYDLFAPGVKRSQQTQGALLDWLMPMLGKGDRTLTAEYKRGTQDIKQAGARNIRRSQMYWSRQGNVGRGRGEEMRNRLATRSALGGLSLDYAGRQREAKMSLLSPISQIGQMGMGGLALRRKARDAMATRMDSHVREELDKRDAQIEELTKAVAALQAATAPQEQKTLSLRK